jgi:methylmalonyl-CoA mutase N-terminal domain/subunit
MRQQFFINYQNIKFHENSSCHMLTDLRADMVKLMVQMQSILVMGYAAHEGGMESGFSAP